MTYDAILERLASAAASAELAQDYVRRNQLDFARTVLLTERRVLDDLPSAPRRRIGFWQRFKHDWLSCGHYNDDPSCPYCQVCGCVLR